MDQLFDPAAMMQYQQQQLPQCCGGQHQRRGPRAQGLIQEVTFGEGSSKKEEEVVGLVVTMCSGSTYDGVFKSVKQKAGEGERVAIYSVHDCSSKDLLQLVRGGSCANLDSDVSQKMLKEMSSLEACTVVWNWECCSGFSGDQFANGKDNSDTIELMAFLLEKGYMVQCSDFSAGALINHWNTAQLGPNPFEKAGTFSDSIVLQFSSDYLKQNEDSAQLQMVGDLCKDEAVLHAMSGTVAFTVKNVKPRVWEEVEVLTAAVQLGGQSAESFGKKLCRTKSGQKGLAGHAIVRFKSGGRLLMGCPHWIEMSNVNVTEERLLAVAKKRYGSDYTSDLQAKLESAPMMMRKEMCKDLGSNFIKQSAPQKYSSKSKFWG